MRGMKAARIFSPAVRVGVQSVTAIPFFGSLDKVMLPILISTRRDISVATALNHLTQRGLVPLCQSHQIHAADLAVQKQRSVFHDAHSERLRPKDLRDPLSSQGFTSPCQAMPPIGFAPRHRHLEARLAPLLVLGAGGLFAQPTQVPPVYDRCKDKVIGRAGDLLDPRKSHNPRQPPILWHLPPQHQKRRYPRC